MSYFETLGTLLLLCVSVLILALLIAIMIVGLLAVIPDAVKPKFSQPRLSTLRSLLERKHWKAADVETNKLILWSLHAEYTGLITDSEVLALPDRVLVAIDELWMHYSNQRFGFSVQGSIYLASIGIDSYDDNCWNLDEHYPGNDTVTANFTAFAEHVGWQTNGQWLPYEALIFDESAPVGHLPAGRWLFPSNASSEDWLFPSAYSHLLYRSKLLVSLMQRWLHGEHERLHS